MVGDLDPGDTINNSNIFVTHDGIATTWSVDRGVNDIFGIRFTGSRVGGAFGLGFDNFNTRSVNNNPVPEPTSLLVWSALTLGCAGGVRRRRRG